MVPEDVFHQTGVALTLFANPNFAQSSLSVLVGVVLTATIWIFPKIIISACTKDRTNRGVPAPLPRAPLMSPVPVFTRILDGGVVREYCLSFRLFAHKWDNTRDLKIACEHFLGGNSAGNPTKALMHDYLLARSTTSPEQLGRLELLVASGTSVDLIQYLDAVECDKVLAT